MATALVTGASRGIGNILARALASAGWRVVVTARNTAKVERLAAELNAERPDTALAVGMDVATPDAVGAGVQAALDFAGDESLELLVNNAGTIEQPASPWDVDPEDWSRVIDTNLVGPFNLIRLIVPGMIERGGGRIVDLNSGGGATGMDDYSAYGASKAGLFRLAQAVQTHGAEHGIKIFEMAPGVVRTEMTAAMPMHEGRTEWTTPEQLAEMIVAIAAGELDDFSGRYIRCGADSPDSLKAEAPGLAGDTRLLRVH